MAFPPATTPSTYGEVTTARANGIFLSGDTVTFTLQKAGATGYTVRDYSGTIVTSGSLSGSTTTCTPTVPAGGWLYGWYRLYLTGPVSDTDFGNSYGAFNFCRVTTDATLPAVPNWGAVGSQGTGARYADLIAHGIMDFGPSRIEIERTATPTVGEFTTSTAVLAATQDQAYWGAVTDTNRPARQSMVSFGQESFDFLFLPLSSAYNTSACTLYAATGSLDPALLTLAKSGTTLTVAYNGSTVETWTGITTGTSLVNATGSSAYIKVFASNYGQVGNTIADFTTTAITGSSSMRAGIISVVTATWPNVQVFEGPANEPQATAPAECAHQMRLFTGAVKAGNAAATSIGPCIVAIIPAWLTTYFAAGGGTYSDGVSFHLYNMVDDDLAEGRRNFDALKTVMTAAGLSSKPIWQTENGTVLTVGYGGIYHPRRAYWYLLQTLLMEQYGLPKERNVLFNDTSHGFWGFPVWFVNGGGSLNPQGPMMRQFGSQTRGKAYTSRFQFGTVGDLIYLGNLYTNPSTSAKVAVFQAAGPQLNGQVILTVTGATSLTVHDCWGNPSTVPVTGGRATIPVGETPVYVQLPSGVTGTLYSFSDWPPVAAVTVGNNLNTPYAPVGTSSATGQLVNAICDQSWLGYRSDGTGAPITATVTYSRAFTVDRVVVHSGQVSQADGTLIDFDIQTSTDGGATWTTRATVTRPTPTSFQHGTASSNTGCLRETYQEGMRVFDVKLPGRFRCNALRLSLRAATYGGEPDIAAFTISGQGNSNQVLTLQQLTPLCDDTATPRYVTVS
jgi:hypothetical protein